MLYYYFLVYANILLAFKFVLLFSCICKPPCSQDDQVLLMSPHFAGMGNIVRASTPQGISPYWSIAQLSKYFRNIIQPNLNIKY